MRLLQLTIVGLLLSIISACDIIPEEGTIIYDIAIPPNIPASLSRSDTSASINENGGTKTLYFSIAAQPKTNSTVHLVIQNPNPTRLSTSANRVTFTNTDWGTKSMTVTGINDFIQNGNVVVPLVLSFTGSDSRYNALGSKTTNITIIDDDAANITITETAGSTSVTEAGSTDTFDVVLNSQPNSTVGVALTHSDSTEGSLSTSSLTFTTGNWNTTQTVTVTGANDNVQDGNVSSTITLSIDPSITSDTNYLAIANKTVAVSTTDDDVAGFTITQTSGSTSVTEMGGTDNVTVVLTSEPTANVTIDISSSDTGEVTVSPSAITFSPGNYTTAQTVTFTGVDDLIDDTNITSTMTFDVNNGSSDTVYAALASQTLSVSNTDNDSAGITAIQSDGTTVVSEAADIDYVSVLLDTEPLGTVVLDISSSDTTEATVSPSTLTYTNLNWNTGQLITVTGVDDNVSEDNVSINSILAVNVVSTLDSQYDLLGAVTVPVIVTDDDSAGFTLAETGGETRVYETGSTDTFTIVLTSEPTNTVQFDVTSVTTSEVIATTSSVTFTAANWNTPQSITVTGADDLLADGNTTNTVTVSINTTNTLDPVYDLVPSQNQSVINNDNDAVGITAVPTYGSLVDETGTTTTYTVVLDSLPTGNVIIDAVSGDTGELTVSPGQLTFTTANWNTQQTVTITGVDDNIADGTINVNVTNTPNVSTADVAYRALGAETIVASTRDNDTAGMTLALTGGNNNVTEPSTTDTYTIALTSEPTGNVVISTSSSDTTEATVSPASLTFTSGNWNTPQTVTLTAADDAVVDGSKTSTITMAINTGSTADSVYDAVDNVTTSVTTTDDDSLGITISPTSATLAEGATQVVGVTIDAQPTANVVVDIASANPNEVTVDTATMTFNSGNWNVAQNVTVTSVNDAVDDGNTVNNVDFQIDQTNTADSVWLATADVNMSITSTDDDTANFTLTESGGSTSTDETGATDTVTIVLTSQPTDVVVIDVSIAGGDSTEVSLSSSRFTFQPASWNTAQTLVLTGLDETEADGNIANTINFDINTGLTLDSTYDSVGQKTVTNTNNDNDNIGITLVCCGDGGPGTSNATAGPISEDAGSNTMTVVLNSQPTGNVILDVTDVYTGVATSSPSSLTFTSSNWSTPQTVTTTSVDDALYRPDNIATTRITPNGGSADAAYGALASQSRRYKITNENDVRGLTFNLGDGLTVTELGTIDTFTVVMDISPGSTLNAVIDIASANTAEVTVSPSQVTFTSGNYNTPQTITVTGVDDFGTDGNQVVNINFTSNSSSTDDYYDSVFSESVSVTNEDNDSPGITFTETNGSTLLNEDGTTDTFTVALTSMPLGGNVIVDISSSDGTEIAGISPNQLTFTNMNWNIDQTVTLTPADDASADNTVAVTITGALNFGTADFTYNTANPSATLTANVADDDAIGYTVACCVTAGGGVGTNSGNAVALNESSGTDNFTVVLNSQPTGDVVFDIIDSADTQASTSPSRLTFTSANWNTPQAVAVSPISDSKDEANLDVTATVDPSLALSADASYGGLGNNVVWFNVVDDDTVGYTVSTTTISVSENATTQSFTVVLDSQPTGDVEFDITNPDTTEVALSDNQLVFTSANWNTAQTINVTGVNDDLDDNDITFNVTVAIDAPNTADGAYDLLGSTNISVTNVDNDEPALVTLTSNTGGLSENGGSVTIQANQDIAVGANTTVTIAVTGGTASAGEYSLTSSSITITAGSLQGTTTITGVNDNTDETTETITIEITGVSGGTGASEDGTQSITLNLNDDDNAGFTVAQSGGNTTVTENGGTDTFTVVLDTTPTGNVRIDLSNDDTTEITYSPVALLFTTGNWNTAQTVTVSPVDDIIEDGTVAEDINLSINTTITADTIYDSVGAQSVSVNINDDDNTGFAGFTLDNITADYARLRLGWTPPSSGFDTSSGSSDSYIMFFTTVAPANRVPAGRMINENDNKTSNFAADKVAYVHGNLSQASTYYYRLGAVASDGTILFTTNELNGSPLPVECSSTTGFINDTDSDLLIYYPFEDDYEDKSPANGRDGSGGWPFHLEEADNAGSIGFAGGCAYGKAVYLDGANPGRGSGSFLQNKNFTNADISSNFTISLWIQPDGDMEMFSSMLSTGNDNDGPEFQIDVDDFTTPVGKVRVFDRGLATRSAKGDVAVIGTWYHIAVVHDGSSNKMYLYQNGLYKDEGRNFLYECNSGTAPSCSTAREMWDKIIIGRNRHGSQKWKGYIDEVKVFNRAFTQSEITALYSKSLPPAPSNTTAASVGGGSADITLTWSAVAGATSYTIYRVENSFPDMTDSITFDNANLDTSGTNITQITNVQAGCTTGTCTYTDSDPGLIFNRYYNYRISSVNAIGTGNPGPITEVNAQAL